MTTTRLVHSNEQNEKVNCVRRNSTVSDLVFFAVSPAAEAKNL